MLVFVEADWPLIGGSFATGGVDVLWPTKAIERMTTTSRPPLANARAVHRHLAGAFPVA
jgi:hypothetical protein